MTRRRFVFWIGFLLFWFSRRLQAQVLDDTAAALMEWSEPTRSPKSELERWRPNANTKWRWYERQTKVDGTWELSGITTPINRATLEPSTEGEGYLDESLVPESVRESTELMHKKLAKGVNENPTFGDGRPPSRWLRSLNAVELRFWLKTITVPEVGVDGMTFWTHLTRDHSFSPQRIRGLTIPEQEKLHAAAHYGY